MAQLSAPAQQAGILSFYDAPEKGPKVEVKTLLIAVLIFVIVIIVLDKVLPL
ncbi:MAG: preprotein translocase subunit Sec61beta [Candidatus Micrarchaeia archaeon]